MILIFLLSNEVANVSSGHSAVIVNAVLNSIHINLNESILTFLIRKAAHIFMYFVLGALMLNVVRAHKVSIKKAILLSIVFSLAYASFDEIHQLFIRGRSGELRDVIIDITASIIGIGIFYVFYRIRLNHLNNKLACNENK